MFRVVSFIAVLSLVAITVAAAQPPEPTTHTSFPRVVRIAGTLPTSAAALSPIETITFAIYADETGGTPLWQETQTVIVDSTGAYNALLGSTVTDGLPLEIFTTNDARWLSIHLEGATAPDPPRVLIASVAYALRAADADTLGGKPASAYVLANPPTSAPPTSAGTTSTTTATKAAGTTPTATTKAGTNPSFLTSTMGTPGHLGLFTDSVNLGDSVAVQSGARIGLGTSSPVDYLHIAFTDPFGAFTGLAVQNLSSNANAASGMLFYDQNGALAQFQGFNNTNHAYVINNIASGGSIKFLTGGADRFVLDGTGHVGMGTTPNACCRLFVSDTTSGAIVGVSSSGRGVEGQSTSSYGVIGFSTSGAAAVAGQSQGSSLAGLFNGNVTITGTLSKGGGSFKIDHPLDPENRYLSHSFVESPDMKNVYDGNVVLDAKGEATVTLPDWFEALNKDFRYQLTALGAPGPNLYVADEIADHRFRIAGGTPGGKVSWMVTGIRQDAWANQNRIPIEQEKPADERGRYLHPAAFGLPLDKGITAVQAPLEPGSVRQQ